MAKPPDEKPKKKKKMTAKEQSERFIQAARELESDETGHAFDEAISRILSRDVGK